MPVEQLPQDATLDAPTSKVEELPKDAPLDPIPGARGFNANAPTLRGVGQAVQGKLESAGSYADKIYQSETMQKFTGRVPDIDGVPTDYNTGTDFADRVAYAQVDNPKELDLLKDKLRDKYGFDSVSEDRAGRIMVKTNGKWRPVDSSGLMGHMAEALVADKEAILASGAAAMAAAGDSPMAPVAGTLGILARLGLSAARGAKVASAAGVGGMGGKLVSEAEKAIDGRMDKTGRELAEAVQEEGVYSAVGQFAGDALAKPVKAIARGGLPRALTNATNESEFLRDYSQRLGVAAPIESAGPGMEITKFHQEVARKLVGRFGEDTKIKALEGEMRRALQDAGVQDVDGAMAQIMKTERIELAPLGSELQKKGQQFIKEIQSAQQRALDETGKIVDKQFTNIEDAIKTPDGTAGLHEKVAQNIIDLDKRVHAVAGRAYENIDQAIGGPVLPTQGIAKAASDLMSELVPRPGAGSAAVQGMDVGIYNTLSKITELAKTPNIDFTYWHHLRSEVGKLAQSPSLNADAQHRAFGELKKSFDDAVSAASLNNPAVAAQAPRITQVDKFYRNAMSKFGDVDITRMVAPFRGRSGQGLQVLNAPELAAKIDEKGYDYKTKEILGMLTPKTREKFAEADWDLIKRRSANPDRQSLNGNKLLAEIDRRKETLDTIYGKETAGQMRQYAERLGQYQKVGDGKIVDLKDLNPDNFGSFLKEAMEQKENHDRWMKKDLMGKLMNEKPKEFEDTVTWLLNPDNETALSEASKFFGPQSQTMQKVREAAIKRIFQGAIDRTGTGVGYKAVGTNILDVLDGKDGYSQTAKKILFPDGTDYDIRMIGRLANFWWPKEASGVAGFAAGAIKGGIDLGALVGLGTGHHALGLGAAAAAYGEAAFFSWLMTKPGFVKYLVKGVEGNPQAMAAARASYEEFLQTTAHERESQSNVGNAVDQRRAVQ